MAFQFNQGDRPLPGYTIQRGVGRGGFGEVYYATSDGGKEVALKYLRENPQVELRGVNHCLNLKSPHLVALHDVKQNADGDFFVVMEYVSGPSLRDLLTNDPDGVGTQKAAYFLREIGKGLAYLHDRGIVHRDLKPGNIFYEDGYVKIGDYGLAKIMAASQHSGQTVSVGTVHYMAPEVGSGNYDRTIDIYALGVILYEMLLGKVPFSGATMGEVLMKHLTAQPEVDALPSPFPRVIRKALEKDPKDRYQTVNEMISDVFAAEDLDKSVAAFEPESLSMIADRAARDLRVTAAAVTLGAGGGGAAIGTGSSNVGQAVPPPVVTPPDDGGFERGGRVGRLHGRFAQRASRVSHRIDGTAFAQQVSRAATTGRGWFGQILVALSVLVGMGWLCMILDDQQWQQGVAVTLHGMIVATGVLLSQRLHGRWVEDSSSWGRRFVTTAVVGAFLIPLFFGLREGLIGNLYDLGDWPKIIIASMLLCDWPRRFLDGRAGHMSLGSAFYAGLFGFIAGAIFTDDLGIELGCTLAASSLAVQAIAATWPLSESERVSYDELVEREEAENDDDEEEVAAVQAAVTAAGHTPGVAINASAAAPTGGRTGNGMEDDASRATAYRVERNTAMRVAWLTLAASVLCLSIAAFIAPAYFKISGREENLYYMGGVAGCFLFLFSLCAAVRRYKAGWWRTYFRPGAFFGGAAFSALSGMAMGLLDLHSEQEFFAIIAIIFGGVVALLVWVIPVPKYMPKMKTQTPKMHLPLRRAFDIDRNVNFAALLERHWTLYGYTLSKRTDLLWSFVRGDWTAQWWQDDIRRWKTQLNIAAYELDSGGYRVTSHLSVDAPFNTPKQTQIAQLDAELREFQELLNGREVLTDTGGSGPSSADA
jgi:hypothetical protein